jgi:hypothetical protein
MKLFDGGEINAFSKKKIEIETKRAMQALQRKREKEVFLVFEISVKI